MNAPVASPPAKRTVEATLVKVMAEARADRGMSVEEFATRCVRVGELHELVATDHDETAPGSRIDRVRFLGFAEIGRGGVIERGDEVVIGGHRVGSVLGFDSCHYPNHYNILVHTREPRTGLELGLTPEALVSFAAERAEPADASTVRTARIDAMGTAPAAYEAMTAFDRAATADVDPRVAELARLRASQINGCSFCISLHTHAARAAGETEERLAALSAWRTNHAFTDREQAALALAESVTLLPSGVADTVYARAAEHFEDKELSHLIWTLAATNAWNRVAVSTGLRAESR